MSKHLNIYGIILTLQAYNYKNSMSSKKLTIAIDGHSSCGKSTVAKDLAKQLKYTYIDSGAMYRSITLMAMQNNLVNGDAVNETVLRKLMETVTIHFTFDEENQKYLTWLNNVLVEDKIRTIEISDNVSIVSKIGFVRSKLVEMQQKLGEQGGMIMDGRDIGTVVFPNADLKIFMTASVKVRAQRRYDEMIANGDNVDFEQVSQNIEKRDYIDQNREIAPLKQAHDAIVLDNSNITKAEQLEKLIDLVKQKS